MLSYRQVQPKPRILKSLTGLTVKEFEALLPSFEQAWQDYIQEQFIDQARNRRYGGGRKPHLQNTCDKLLFILFYFRHYPTQEVQGFLFGIERKRTNGCNGSPSSSIKPWAMSSNCLSAIPIDSKLY